MSSHAQAWLAKRNGATPPDEFDVKALLRSYGIATPPGIRLGPQEAMPVLDFSGPYVVKVCSGRVLHKTDAGGVVLHVLDKNLAATIEEVRARFPGESLLIEQQSRKQGSECIVGGLVDPEFGPAVMVGAGGILTELYRDVAFRLAPCSKNEALYMIEELRIAPLFAGFRGSPLQADGLAEIISQSGQLSLDLGEAFMQLDINPVAFDGDKWVALDAKLALA